ncbi:hypothetical protein EJ06DRAFT_48954 [Trichodelitschia bisporula]|uniref:Uncharacterized protein n=1 Tax=Trichodelitschia bisporula TaxID=703511 RepID=A0A6G1HTQ2_9PEZI|nr:hypothetical protein EJ06DRAFT_48954 [Trichodelitschia bisporula]
MSCGTGDIVSSTSTRPEAWNIRLNRLRFHRALVCQGIRLRPPFTSNVVTQDKDTELQQSSPIGKYQRVEYHDTIAKSYSAITVTKPQLAFAPSTAKSLHCRQPLRRILPIPSSDSNPKTLLRSPRKDFPRPGTSTPHAASGPARAQSFCLPCHHAPYAQFHLWWERYGDRS